MRARPFLWVLRHLPEDWHRPMAKAAYWCAGHTSRIKTYKRFYRMEWDDPDELPRSIPGGRRWTSCGFSMKLLNLSMQLDWDHWDHWACQHNDCNPEPCDVCGGLACNTEEMEELL